MMEEERVRVKERKGEKERGGGWEEKLERESKRVKTHAGSARVSRPVAHKHLLPPSHSHFNVHLLFQLDDLHGYVCILDVCVLVC
jgi:hypothetical protein